MRGLVGGGTWKEEEGNQLRAGANEPRLECGQLWGEGGWGTMEEITVTVVGIRVRQRRVSGFQKLGRRSRLCNKNGLLIHVMAE